MPLPALVVLLPWVFAALRIFLVVNVVGFVVRIVAALGFTFYILEPIIDQVTGIMVGRFGLLPSEVAVWIGFFNIDKYVSLILSAYGIQVSANFVLRMNR